VQHHDAQCALLEHARTATAPTATIAATRPVVAAMALFIEQAAAMVRTVVALVHGAVARLAVVAE